MRPLLLITNDDGWNAPGLGALWRALEHDYETIIVAPARQRSWSSKAFTYPGPLTLEEKSIEGKAIQVLHDGLPADCANIGIFHLCPRPPDLVISGINTGPNFTTSLALASGTVGAALEAAQNGILGLAVSLDLEPEPGQSSDDPSFREEWARAAEITNLFVERLFVQPFPPSVKLINLVLPRHCHLPPQFVQCEPLSYQYGSVFVRRPDGYYNRGSGFLPERAAITPDTDVSIVQRGQVAFVCYTGKLELAEPKNGPFFTSSNRDGEVSDPRQQ